MYMKCFISTYHLYRYFGINKHAVFVIILLFFCTKIYTKLVNYFKGIYLHLLYLQSFLKYLINGFIIRIIRINRYYYYYFVWRL